MIRVSTYKQRGLYERIIRAQDGSLVRVTFEVYEFEGSIKGRVVSVQPIIQLAGEVSSACHLLCSTDFKSTEQSSVSLDTERISPYFDLYFFTSQPTRAPNIF